MHKPYLPLGSRQVKPYVQAFSNVPNLNYDKNIIMQPGNCLMIFKFRTISINHTENRKGKKLRVQSQVTPMPSNN